MYFPLLTIADARNFKDAFEKCQATLSDKDEDELAQEMNKLKVESAKDSTGGQQESDEKKEEKTTLQESKTKTESTTDPQTSSKDSAAITEDNKPTETK